MSLLLRRGLLGSISGGAEIYNETFTARNFSSSPLAIPRSLKGDSFDYQLVCHFSSASGDSILNITLNSDATANYRNYEMKGLSTTASGSTGDADSAIELQNLIGTASPNLLMMDITGSSGDERYISASYAADAAILKQSSYWKNTANELDEITLTAASSVTCDAHIILYKFPKTSTQGLWEYISTLTWSAETAEKSFTSLLGDTDKKYKLVWEGDQELNIELNNDTTTYKRQYLQNATGTLSAANSTSETSIVSDGINSTFIIDAETGVKRLVTTSGSNTASAQQSERAHWYDDTATEITTIDCTPAASSTGAAKLYKAIVPANTADTLSFELIESVAISADFSGGHTFSSLTGDSENLYKLEFLGSAASGNPILNTVFNSDTTAANYTMQWLRGYSGSVDAVAGSAEGRMSRPLLSNHQCRWVLYLYPKSGYNRVALSENNFDELAVVFQSAHWLNSGSEITTIKVSSSTSAVITGTLKLSRLI